MARAKKVQPVEENRIQFGEAESAGAGIRYAPEDTIVASGATSLTVSVEPKKEAPGPVVVALAIEDMTNAIVGGVADSLHKKIAANIEKANALLAIKDAKEYVLASEHRKFLKGLVNKAGNTADPSRLRARISLSLVDQSGENKVAFAVETTIGTESLEDLYGPLAEAFNKFHKATTRARGEMEQKIEGGRKLLETSILHYEDDERKKREEAERKQRLINEQNERTNRAMHWIKLLGENGYAADTCQALLVHPLPQVTDVEINVLETLLRERMEDEQRAIQEKELAGAIQQAKDLGMDDIAMELEAQSDEPVVLDTPAYVPPPPPPIAAPVASAVASSQIPDVKGQGRGRNYKVTIENPLLIPAEFLLPPEAKIYDADAYPRVRAEARSKGLRTNIPGVRVEEEARLTQR